MNEEVIASYLKNNGFETFKIIDLQASYDSAGNYEVVIFIPKEDFSKASQLDCFRDFDGRLSVSFRVLLPELSPAKLGDFVLLPSEYGLEDNVGVVTSVYNTPPPPAPIGALSAKEGSTAYGVSYVHIALHNRFRSSDLYSFELTAENYGGYHKGFVKILSKEEFEAFLKVQLQQQYNKRLEELKVKKDRTDKKTSEFVDWIATGKKCDAQHLKLDESRMCLWVATDQNLVNLKQFKT